MCVRKRQRLDRSLCMCVSAKSGDWIAMLHALQTMIRNSDWIAVYVCVRKTAIGSLCRCVCIRPQSYRPVVSAQEKIIFFEVYGSVVKVFARFLAF